MTNMFTLSFWISLVPILSIFVFFVYCDSSIVDLGYSLHRGYLLTAADGTQYYNFSNVRFAASPTGERRFQAPTHAAVDRSTVQTGQREYICPQGVETWLDVASEVVSGASLTYSAVPPFGPSNRTVFDHRQTEDCLFLDLLVPRRIFENRHHKHSSASVLLSFHASSNTQGSKTFYGDGAGLVSRSVQNGRPGVIYVAPNYRLGLFGFLAGTDALQYGEPNAAILDQRFAMQWVKNNIHLFGGDPEDVTMLGKSSAGGDVLVHVTAYGGKNGPAPFTRAIAQSAFLQYISPATAEATYAAALNYSGVSTYAQLKCLPSLQLQRINALLIGQAFPYGTFVFGPTVDGRILPDNPPSLLLRGAYDKSVQILTGLSSDEGLLLTSPFVTTTAQYNAFLHTLLPSANASTCDYVSTHLYPPDFSGTYGYTTPLTRLDRTIGDYAIVCPTVYLQNAYPPASSYQYQFTVPPGVHAQDLGYTYFYEGAPQNLGAPTNPPVNSSLAMIMQQYLTAFAQKGNPNVKGLPFFPLDAGEIAQGFNDSDVGPVRRRFVSAERCDWWQKGLYR